MTVPQLVEVIMDAYGARTEIKDYFEYFLNPDVNKLRDKYLIQIAKEFSRSKWRQSKGRVSVINKAIKEFKGYQTGTENELNFYVSILTILMDTEFAIDLTDTQWKCADRMIMLILENADKGGFFEQYIKILVTMSAPETEGVTRRFKQAIRLCMMSYDPVATLGKL